MTLLSSVIILSRIFFLIFWPSQNIRTLHICCDFRKLLILFCSAIQLITLHVYESIKYSPGECKKILIWISTWCNITLLFGGLWIISSLFVKCIIKVGLFCEEAEGKAPSEPRRRSRDSVLKKVRKLKGFSALNKNKLSHFELKRRWHHVEFIIKPAKTSNYWFKIGCKDPKPHVCMWLIDFELIL